MKVDDLKKGDLVIYVPDEVPCREDVFHIKCEVGVVSHIKDSEHVFVDYYYAGSNELDNAPQSTHINYIQPYPFKLNEKCTLHYSTSAVILEIVAIKGLNVCVKGSKHRRVVGYRELRLARSSKINRLFENGDL